MSFHYMSLSRPIFADHTYTKTVICEGSTGFLACPEGQIIRVHRVTWGASSGGFCRNTASDQQTCPESQTAPSKVYSLCTDKTSCEIAANVENLGDQCAGVPKLLYIEHQCLTYPRSGE